MTLLTKYEPQSFDDLLFEDPSVREELRNYAEKKITGHIILDGDNGVGKSMTAKVIAQLRLSEPEWVSKIIYQPGGNNPLQKEDLKGLMEDAGLYRIFTGSSDYFRVFNEVDRLSTAHQHKLLAAMEWATFYGYYILTTNNYDKLNKALRSRCQRYTLSLFSDKTLLPFCRKILQAENVQISDDKLLALIAETDRTIRGVERMLTRSVCKLAP